MVKGFLTISDIQLYWKNCEDAYLKSSSATYYQNLIEPLSNLYSHLLEYQVRAICHLSKKQLSRAWEKVAGQDDWAKKETELTEISNRCKEHILPLQQSELRQQFDTEMSKLDRIGDIGVDIVKTIQDEKEKSKVESFIQNLSSAAGEYFKGMDYNKDPVAGTCEWFYEDDDLSRWLHSNDGGVFWITAGPGCGKSVLARSLVTNGHLSSIATVVDMGPPSLTITSNQTTVCYFFFKDEGGRQRSSICSAMSALLHQLFTQDPSGTLVRESLAAFTNNGDALTRRFDELWKVLVHSAQIDTGGDIICVLDALDECDPNDRDSFVRKLDRLYTDESLRSSIRLKFLITSRPYSDIIRSFQPISRRIDFYRFDADDRHEQISHDINLVIDSEVQRFLTDLSKNDYQKIAEALKSQGTKTYLWLHLTLDIINRDPSEYSRRRDIETLLRSLPMEVSDAYEKILCKSKRSAKTRLLLQIILAAEYPLSLEEANYALTLAESDETFTSHTQLKEQCWPQDFKTTVNNLCGLIVNVYDGKLAFIHLTAREFLTKPRDPGMPAMQWAGCFADSAAVHEVLARCCMQYLLLSDFSMRSIPSYYDATRDFGFLNYAALNWPGHFRALDPEISSNYLPQAFQLCDTSSPPLNNWGGLYINYYRGNGPKYYSFKDWSDLAVASFVGISPIVQKLLRDGADINEICAGYGSALHSAVAGSHKTVASLLISEGAKVDETLPGFRGTPLDIAVALRQHCGLIELLLENGASPLEDSRNGRFVDTGFMEYTSGNSEISRRKGNAILRCAAILPSVDIFSMLLKSLVDISTTEKVVLASKDDRIIECGAECVARLLDLLDDVGFETILTEDNLPILFSIRYVGERAIRLLKVTGQEELLLNRHVLVQSSKIDGINDILQKVVIQQERPWKAITEDILKVLTAHYQPSTLRAFISHSPEGYDIKHLLEQAMSNWSHAEEVCLVILEFTSSEISLNEPFQNELLKRFHANSESVRILIKTLLQLPRHSFQMQKRFLTIALNLPRDSFADPTAPNELIQDILNRCGYIGLVDAETLEVAAGRFNVETLKILFEYSSGVCMADERFLIKAAGNFYYGRDVMEFLLNKYQTKAIITPAVAARAARHGRILLFMLDVRPHEVDISIELLAEIYEEKTLLSILESRREEVAAIASAVLHRVASKESQSRPGRFGLWVNCCPPLWFEPSDDIFLSLMEDSGFAHLSYLALLIEAFGDRIEVTETIIAAAASCRMGEAVLQVLKIWRPKDFKVTPWVVEKVAAAGGGGLSCLNRHFDGDLDIDDRLLLVARLRDLVSVYSPYNLQKMQDIWADGVVPHLSDVFGKTLLHIVADKNMLQYMFFLLDVAHFNVHAVEHRGWTPLHFAANTGSLVGVLILLWYGADPYAISLHGDTAISLATRREHWPEKMACPSTLLLALQDDWFARFWTLGLGLDDEALRFS